MTDLPRCEDCGFRFDPDDPRASPPRWGLRCPLCETIERGIHRHLAFAMRNDCQGLFDDEVFASPAAAAEKWDREDPVWREWTNADGVRDGKIVPVVLVEISRDHPAHFYAVCEGQNRDAQHRRWLREERAGLLTAIVRRVEKLASSQL